MHLPDSPKLAFVKAPRGAHQLLLLPAGDALPEDLTERASWQRLLKRRRAKAADLARTPLATDLADGSRAVLVMVDGSVSRFERLSLLRRAAMLLLEESPKTLCVVPLGVAQSVIQDAVYVLTANGRPLPQQRRKPPTPLEVVEVCGRRAARADFLPSLALAWANGLARELISLPPNELTPLGYRRRLRQMACKAGWKVSELGYRQLRKLGAGAFCAVAQGSGHEDAAIVRLAYRPRGAQRKLALVGKGICFDTGGHNLKPGSFMAGMHTDMGGSAIALALLSAATELCLPVAIDCWLAIAQNHLSPEACVPGDVVQALDGTTIEIVHTDAEGRMVLADALVLAARERPDLVIDFATLTGSMKTALGRRYAGVFATSDELAAQAVAAGRRSGERLCAFPLDADYEPALDSKVADIKQCSLEGGADHILAALFLRRFTQSLPWLHLDLSATNCPGGLGGIATDITGFGVGWGLEFLQDWLGSPG